jgi:hypothetical protein
MMFDCQFDSPSDPERTPGSEAVTCNLTRSRNVLDFGSVLMARRVLAYFRPQ